MNQGEFDGLAAPAMRALAGRGLKTLMDVSACTRTELAALHGMGPNGLAKLEAKLTAKGLAFSPE